MVLLDNETFLAELSRMFLSCRDKSKGTLYITCKQHHLNKSKKKGHGGGAAAAAAAAAGDGEPVALYRAVLNKRKVSTTVNHKEVTKFQMAYASLLRANMDSLKKKDRRARKKDKAESE